MTLIVICLIFILVGCFVLFLKKDEEKDEIEKNFKYRLRGICPCYRMSKGKIFPLVYIYFGGIVFIYNVIYISYVYDFIYIIYAVLSFLVMAIGAFLK